VSSLACMLQLSQQLHKPVQAMDQLRQAGAGHALGLLRPISLCQSCDTASCCDRCLCLSCRTIEISINDFGAVVVVVH
jgi:hypothetical protein